MSCKIWKRKLQKGNVLFNNVLNTFYLRLCVGPMVKDYSYSKRGNPLLPLYGLLFPIKEARCSSVVRAFAHGAMGRRIDPSWSEPIELFLVPVSAPRLV